MRKIREVLRLRLGLGLGQEQIARSCSISQATVHRYLERAAATGLGWPLPEDCDERRLNELLFPARPAWPASPQRAAVDFSQIQAQLQTHKHLTLQAGLGGIPGSSTGRLQPFLRALSTVAPESRRGAAAGAPRR